MNSLQRAGMSMLSGIGEMLTGGRFSEGVQTGMEAFSRGARRMPRPVDPSAIVSRTRRGFGGMFGSTTRSSGRNYTETMTKKGLFGMGGRSGSIKIHRGMMD